MIIISIFIKDPSQSTRIPRLDGVSRIPGPSSLALRITKHPTKISAKQTLLGLRAVATNLLPKSSSSDKICQTKGQSRFFLRSRKETLPSSLQLQLNQDGKMDSNILRQSATKASDLTRNEMPTDKQNLTKSLTRSETFTRDCDDDDGASGDNAQKMTHSTIVTQRSTTYTAEDEFLNRSPNLTTLQKTYAVVNAIDVAQASNAVNNVQNVNSPIVISDSAKTLDSVALTNSTPQAKNCLRSSNNCTSNDVSIFGVHRSDNNYSPIVINDFDIPLDSVSLNHSTPQSNNGSMSIVDGDSTITPFFNSTKHIVNSTMVQHNKLLEISETISPARQLTNISQEVPDGVNTSQLLYDYDGMYKFNV